MDDIIPDMVVIEYGSSTLEGNAVDWRAVDTETLPIGIEDKSLSNSALFRS